MKDVHMKPLATKTLAELYRDHGTPAEFAAAVWYASDTLMITPEEAQEAVRKYDLEWRAAEQREHA